jgi:16S rRNA G966 N2-methylase RsmD
MDMITGSNVAKRDFLFRLLPHSTRITLKLDEESLYSTTDQLTADKITKDILKYVPKTSTITDATACIGGTALAFSKEFKQVNAVEINETRFQYLQHNIMSLNTRNVYTIKGDAVEVCKCIYQDVIFIDPPWGGPEYKQLASVSLFLSGIPLHNICKTFHYYADYLVIKVPTNFDEDAFISNTSSFMEQIHKNTTLRKMHLLIFRTFKTCK